MSTEVTVNLTTTPIELTATITTGGGGNVTGPASSTDGNVAVFDGTTGRLLDDTDRLRVVDGNVEVGTTDDAADLILRRGGDIVFTQEDGGAETARNTIRRPTLNPGDDFTQTTPLGTGVNALTSQEDGSITSADIADAAADHTDSDNYGKAVLSDANGLIKGQSVWGYDSIKVGSADREATIGAADLTANRAMSLPDASGMIPVVSSYADESTANTAEAANVLYYNEATGKFQVTTA